MQTYGEKELEALEKNQKTTDVEDVVNIFDNLFNKLEDNQEKKEKAVEKREKEIKEKKRKEKVESVISEAMKQKGKPYLWGGTGPNRFDCSGLMLWSFSHNGYDLPRVAADQAQTSKHLKRSELKRGDMIFFKTDKKQPWRVSHVGLYLGSGKFLHAPRTGDVIKISSLTGRCAQTFCWGVRVIK